MWTLIRFEMKKIIMKRSTMISFSILLAIQIFLAIAGSLGSTYANDVFVETHAERNRIDRAHGIALTGRKIDDMLLAEVQDAYAKVDWSNRDYMLTDVYGDEVRKYENVITRLKTWYGSSVFAGANLTEEVLYDLREQSRDGMWEAYELTDKEKVYWLKKDADVDIPFMYEYALGFEMLVDMNGLYMTCMLLTFFIAISMVTVFADEHILKTDQLILCARFGKGKAYFAKLLAEVLKNSIGAMAVVVGLLFAARLVPVPPSLGVLSQAWNYLPINLLKVDEGFLDLRLVNLFGLQLTSWQFAPVLYMVLIGMMVFVGSKVYRKYQVSGR